MQTTSQSNLFHPNLEFAKITRNVLLSPNDNNPETRFSRMEEKIQPYTEPFP